MAEVSLEWHDDWEFDASGDLLLVEGDDEVRQRLERRLFTAIRGYVWHPDYAAGLPQKIGDGISREIIEALIRSQIGLEASVALSPPCKIKVWQDANQPDTVGIDITYWDAKTGVAVSFTITT